MSNTLVKDFAISVLWSGKTHMFHDATLETLEDAQIAARELRKRLNATVFSRPRAAYLKPVVHVWQRVPFDPAYALPPRATKRPGPKRAARPSSTSPATKE